MRKHKRNIRSTLIEPFSQIKLGVYVIGISLTFLIMAGSLIFYAFYKQYEHVMEIFQVVDPALKWELVVNDVFYSNAIMLAALCVVYVSILFFVVFKMTHKIYGPLVSIERFVRDVKQLKLGRVIIRKGDELQRLVNELNEMAESLEEALEIDDRRNDSSAAK